MTSLFQSRQWIDSDTTVSAADFGSSGANITENHLKARSVHRSGKTTSILATIMPFKVSLFPNEVNIELDFTD